ncbi:MAG: TIR domain-containing protein, partial [Anaerolineales bacterium]
MKAPAQIFLSYAREDEKKVESLYQKLSNAGFKPWMDKKDIRPGERWEFSIRRAIRDSDFFVACLSANSVAKRGWIQREIKRALDLWQEKLEDDIYLIPVRLEDCEMPESLHDIQWVDLFKEDGWTQLVKAIRTGMERWTEVLAYEEPSLDIGITTAEEGPEQVLEFEPYVGPRPFERDDQALFFGRDHEASELLSLVIAHRVLLLYAQSGAGKTSLLNAKLIPLLEGEEFEVLPLVRVQGLIPKDIEPKEILNLYTFNTLMSWAEPKADTRQLAQMSIADFLKQRERPIDEEGLPSPRVVIFDQFEELFTFYSERWRDREGFFEQVRDALEEDPLLRVVFVIREDYIAQLDPYAPLLPEKLRARFRLERLREGAALAAVTGPLRDTGRSFAESVAEQLVEDLLKVRVQSAIGGTVEVTGEFIEPVQLQVVCQSLWRALPPDVTAIAQEHLQAFGDVNQALSGFYERSIKRAAQEAGVKEENLRAWFDSSLITPAGTRGTVFRGREETGGIPNTAADVLDNLHLIRGERRAGALWYELTHDRFIEPIQESNKTWRERKSEEQAKKRLTVLVVLGTAMATLIVVILLMASAMARANQNRADYQARLATSRRLAAQALTLLDGQLDLALLLSLEANRLADTVEARASLLAGLEFSPHLATFLHGHTDWVRSVDFSPDGRTLASGNADGTIILWDVATGQPIGQPLTGHTKEVRSVDFSPDGQTLASASEDNTIILWDVATGQPIGQPLTGHTEEVRSVDFSPDGQTLASGSRDLTIILWDVVNCRPIGQPLTGHTEEVRSVDFSPDGRTLASGSYDNTIILWDVETGQPVGQPLTDHRASVYSVAFSPDGRTLASGSQDLTIILWDVATGQPIIQSLTGHSDGVFSVAFSPDGQTLASGSADKTIILWNLANDPPIGQPFIGHSDSVLSVAFSPDGQTLASGSRGPTIILWDVVARQPLTNHMGAVLNVAFSPDGQTLASGSADKTITLWDIATGQLIGQPLTGHTAKVLSVAFSPDGQILASGSADNTIILWDVATGQPIGQPLTGHTAPMRSVAFSLDGKTLASGGEDNTIILWDVTTGQPIGQPLTDHTDAVLSIAFSPDSKTLASASEDNTIILWDVATRQPIGQPLTDHTDAVLSIAFSPDGKTLASGSADQTIIL